MTVATAATVLKVDGLVLARGERQILRGVSLAAARGEIVALMGLSGGGKTTVLRAIVALEAFNGGFIDVDGVVLRPGPVPKEKELSALRRKVGIVFQLHNLFDHLSVASNVTLAPVHTLGKKRHEAEERAASLLASLGVGHRAAAFPRELSGGEAQRVAIARALAMDPPLLLMDEPTASLDPARQASLGETLEALVAQGRTIILTCHDDDFVRDFATRVLILADGQVVEEGDPEVVLTTPVHEATKRLLQSGRKDAPKPTAAPR